MMGKKTKEPRELEQPGEDEQPEAIAAVATPESDAALPLVALDEEPTPPLGTPAPVAPPAAEDARFCDIVGSTVTTQANGRCVVCNVAWHQHPRVGAGSAR